MEVSKRIYTWLVIEILLLVLMNGNMQWVNRQSYDAESNATLLIYAVSGATHRSAVVCRSWHIGGG